jgi:hypothetical protein
MNNLKIIARLNITALNIRAYWERLVCWVSDHLAMVENFLTSFFIIYLFFITRLID